MHLHQSRGESGLTSHLSQNYSRFELFLHFTSGAALFVWSNVPIPDSQLSLFRCLLVCIIIILIFLETPLYLFCQLLQEYQFADSFIRCALFLAGFVYNPETPDAQVRPPTYFGGVSA